MIEEPILGAEEQLGSCTPHVPIVEDVYVLMLKRKVSELKWDTIQFSNLACKGFIFDRKE